jgi:hypothetical protein
MNYSLKIPVVSRNTSPLQKLAFVLYLTFSVFALVTVFLDRYKMLIVISGILAFASFLFLVIISFITKTISIDGYIQLTMDTISVNISGVDRQFLVDSLKSLYFKFHSYEGEYDMGSSSLFPSAGVSNFIVIQTYENETHKFELLLQRQNYSILASIFQNWKILNPSFQIKNKMGLIIKSF